MSTPPPSAEFEPAPKGRHIARCYGMIDLGTQPQEYMGQPKPAKREFVLLFEMPKTRDANGEPFTVMKWCKLTDLGKKTNLYQMIRSWSNGKAPTQEQIDNGGFDPESLVGMPCGVLIDHTDGDSPKAKIDGFPQGLDEGVEVPEQHNERVVFYVDEPDMAIFGGLPEFLTAKIQASPEWQASQGAAAPAAGGGGGWA
ncbi:MAG: hypothetical protein AAFV77_13715 [Planctomycetota bacterium]